MARQPEQLVDVQEPLGPATVAFALGSPAFPASPWLHYLASAAFEGKRWVLPNLHSEHQSVAVQGV